MGKIVRNSPAASGWAKRGIGDIIFSGMTELIGYMLLGMQENNLQNILTAIVMLVLGICLIVFRKKFPGFLIRKQLYEIATPRAEKAKRDLQQLKQMKLDGILYKMLEIAAIIFGVLLILISISEFFPKTEKYIDFIIIYFMLSLFAAGAASIVELIFIFPLLWKKVRKYTLDYYGILSQNIQNSSGANKINAAMSGPTDDPVLRTLQRRAIIYSIICFVPLFLIVLLAFCTLYILTS